MNSETAKVEILVVDDSKVIRWAATKILNQDYTVHEACDGNEAWAILQENKNIAAVFSDLQMKGADGYELLNFIRSSDDLRLINLPVIIITGKDDDDDTKSEVLNLGATDFISKPFDSVTLKSRAAAYIGYTKKLASVDAKLEQDALTGLANKHFFFAHGEKDHALAARHGTELTVAFVVVDQFSDIISKFGKQIAARALLKISQSITNCLRIEDLAARVDTATFALILPLTNRIGGQRSIYRICEKLNTLNLKTKEGVIHVKISAGLISLDGEEEYENFMQFAERAKIALNSAVSSGGQCLVSANDNKSYPLDTTAAERSSWLAAEQVEADKIANAVNGLGPEISQAINKLNAGKEAELEQEQLARLMQAILPLMKHGSEQLDLGLEAALEAATEKLG
ncbi:hypothetical protein MNBD_GAMMA26-718 [hydrothermal vent metagenome]|uniref:Uncharacterized protein n=1 Tax=hydrothermal vent metagenome TaxID=652676 RepID=A0A3B1AUJ9_9ZZZZ